MYKNKGKKPNPDLDHIKETIKFYDHLDRQLSSLNKQLSKTKKEK